MLKEGEEEELLAGQLGCEDRGPRGQETPGEGIHCQSLRETQPAARLEPGLRAEVHGQGKAPVGRAESPVLQGSGGRLGRGHGKSYWGREGTWEGRPK